MARPRDGRRPPSRGLEDLKNALADGVGRSIGPWRTERLLGRGGVGAVYAARHESSGAEAALKILDTRAGGRARARFERSVRLASELDHPCLVLVYGGGVEDGQAYVALELVDGIALSVVIRERGALELPQARGVCRDIGHALAYLHARGLVHRDIKPSNILVARDGSIRLTDFDLLRHAGMAGENLTDAGTALGTAAYMAPEQIRGESVDARADVYALGASWYQLVAGVPPFGSGSLVELGAVALGSEAAPIGRLRDELPPAEASLITAMIARDPAARPPLEVVLEHLERETAVAMPARSPARAVPAAPARPPATSPPTLATDPAPVAVPVSVPVSASASESAPAPVPVPTAAAVPVPVPVPASSPPAGPAPAPTSPAKFALAITLATTAVVLVVAAATGAFDPPPADEDLGPPPPFGPLPAAALGPVHPRIETAPDAPAQRFAAGRLEPRPADGPR